VHRGDGAKGYLLLVIQLLFSQHYRNVDLHHSLSRDQCTGVVEESQEDPEAADLEMEAADFEILGATQYIFASFYYSLTAPEFGVFATRVEVFPWSTLSR
jgi:hypothetical protein